MASPFVAGLAALLAALVAVAGGRFVMGSDEEADERPAHTVILPAFYIDRDEVTVGEYRVCVAAGGCRAPASLAPTSEPRLPMTGVSWYDADAYCRSVGRRLPTEAEWERAARGPGGRRFPWGERPDCRRANFGSYEGEGRCPENPGRPVVVGSYGGAIHDLAGNVWEWVADWYGADYYRSSPRRAPHGPVAGERRVVRGGACCSMFGLPRAANRLAFPPDYRDDDLGFRCAADRAQSSEAPRVRQ